MKASSSSSSWLLDVADVVPDVVPRPRSHDAEPPPACLGRRRVERREQLGEPLSRHAARVLTDLRRVVHPDLYDMISHFLLVVQTNLLTLYRRSPDKLY